MLVLLLVAGASATALLGAGASAALPAPANLEPPVISGTAVAGKPLGSTLRFGVKLSAMPANAGGARSAPDLRVSHVSLGIGRLTVGGAFTATVKVQNAGRTRARTTITAMYLSVDKRKGKSDSRIGNVKVPALAPHRAKVVHAHGTVPLGAVPAKYHVLVCADVTGRVREANEHNNCRAVTGRVMPKLGSYGSPVEAVSKTPEFPGPQAPDPVIAAAGDIACGAGKSTVQPGVACDQLATSNLLVGAGLSAVLPLGDDQYERGQLSDFVSFFDPSWGRFKGMMRSVVGNHEYEDPTGEANGYFDYFDGVGSADGPAGPRGLGYYSFDIARWHLIALNSNCNPDGAGWRSWGCAAGSTQERWLRADLSAHPSSCTLAFWHHPLYSSSSQPDGASPFMSAIWADLANAHADVVLNGHAHNYERFALQNASGAVDTSGGVREFVIGTGGRSLYPFSTINPNSEVRNASTFGILRLTLHPTSYDWQFQPEAGATFTDTGSQACHGR